MTKNTVWAAGGLAILAVLYFSFIGHDEVDYNTEVKPILNRKCLACHGGVKKSGGFSLLFQEEALAVTKSGKPAILPGDADHSEFIKRLTDPDPDRRMPRKGSLLTSEEIEILTKWVDQGANFDTHWAYKRIELPDVPTIGTIWSRLGLTDDVESSWAKNNVDHFILNGRPDGLNPSPEADRATLLRRVSLDLTGLPPSPALYQSFMADKSENAYENVVDSLLKSPAFGERWASMWLDQARYADSRGYEKDDIRTIWRYRDWVIQAFNDDKPYDRFITEQLAGDLLAKPDGSPTSENLLIATGFHRNTLNNDEGGTDDEEFRLAEVMDRVNTNWVAFSGTTFACVQCHSHPYDPFRHEEYYKQMAFFNNTQDADIEDDSPVLRFFNDADQKKLDSLTGWVNANLSARKAQETVHFLRTLNDRIPFTAFDRIENGVIFNSYGLYGKNGGSIRLANAPILGRRKLIIRINEISKPGGTITIYTDSLRQQPIAVMKLDTAKRAKIHTVDLPLIRGRRDLYFVFQNPAIPKGSTDNVALLFWLAFRNDDLLPGADKPGHAQYQKLYNQLLYAKTDNLPIMLENAPANSRVTKVFERGSFMTQTKPVQPDVPKSLNPWPKNAPRNRLGLAMWLTDRDNPLTARTAVNRFWEQLFGTGLVETLEDMGSQGFAPTHPELLDYLAYRFMVDYKWQAKPLLKEIVLSATYRQDSRTSNAALAADPNNKFLMRGVRLRLTAEQIRDQSLAVSGLLNPKMFGKPVMPYQPAGLWQTVYSGHKWILSKDGDAYRRAVYTFIRRSSPYPNILTFDGTSREVCLARRIRTNTPLQALATLNDSAYVEMAQHFAGRMQRESGPKVEQQLNRGYYLMTGHSLPAKKQVVLQRLYQDALTRYRNEPTKRKDWVATDSPERAALAVVANVMLNMDEFIVRQ